ncbi:APC family permease [Rubrivivax gelatinosus]|uniref:APC family permease n=1 Tax=Rubrivivax gelatinosus TaxID=28068 RepID=UPI001A1CF460|nr:APC family permease [Rubrivivax gelatinosus]MBG6081150.1 amino acid transporter [Rubrivivax gelatinosus]
MHAPSADAKHGGASPAPRPQLDVRHAVAVCVGMVIGAGIFKTSPMVAASLTSDTAVYAAWVLGGVLSFVGALCFAELASAFPDPGGDYHFLRLAYGRRVGLLFAWSRFAVIHSGSMALLAFVFGDYLDQLAHLGPYGSAVFAAAVIVVLLLLNLRGIRVGVGTQLGLMLLVVSGLLAVGAAGAVLAWQGVAPATPLTAAAGAGRPAWGEALVFVFLAYGGWSDAATLSAEMRDTRRGIVQALLLGLTLVAALYLLANWAFLRGLGLAGMAASSAPAADLLRRAAGPWGEAAIVGVVAVTSITVMNAVLIAGARTTYAAMRDLPRHTPLGDWDARRGTPRAALLALGAVALALVGLGTATRGGFATMVDYLSPVYWFFLLLSGGALIVLRRRRPEAPRPFRVPLFPLLPLLFMSGSAYLLWSSLVYVKAGAVAGLVVLAVGGLLLWPLLRPGRGLPDDSTHRS